MLFILRKLRQAFITENKLSNYLIYAVGEIVLVVIGILIAVSIDNWNDYRKDRLVEKEILEEIADNLESNILLIETKISFYEMVNKSTDTLLQLRGEKVTYHDSLGLHIYSALQLAANFHIPRPSYEVLKNKGFNIVQDQTLRKEIVKLFDEVYPLTNIRFADLKTRSHIHQNYIDQNFWTVHLNSTPVNPDKTFNDIQFYSLIHSIKYGRTQLINWLKEDLNKTKKVLSLITKSSTHESNP